MFSDVRGNINTRLAKLDAPNGPYTALILAAAGLVRLNLHSRITAFLSSPVLLHSVGQGSLAIEVRTPPEGADPTTNRDARIRELIRSIGDWRATFRAEAERALLKELEGGCSIPVGVETRFDDHDQVEGQRSEAVDMVDDFITQGDADAKADLPNGGMPLIKDGHTIPASQLSGTAETLRSPPQRPPLESLATGVQEMEAAKAQAKTNPTPASTSAATIAEKIVSTSYSIVDRSTPVSEGRTLRLDAIVVSLDGSQESRYSASKHCTTLEDARELVSMSHTNSHTRKAQGLFWRKSNDIARWPRRRTDVDARKPGSARPWVCLVARRTLTALRLWANRET